MELKRYNNIIIYFCFIKSMLTRPTKGMYVVASNIVAFHYVEHSYILYNKFPKRYSIDLIDFSWLSENFLYATFMIENLFIFDFKR